MDAEEAGRLRYVSITVGQYPLNVLPLDARERGDDDRRGGFRLDFAAFERGEHLIRIDGFREVVRGSQPHALERGRDAAVSRQHHDARRRIDGVQIADDVEAVFGAEFQIDDGEFGAFFGGGGVSSKRSAKDR